MPEFEMTPEEEAEQDLYDGALEELAEIAEKWARKLCAAGATKEEVVQIIRDIGREIPQEIEALDL